MRVRALWLLAAFLTTVLLAGGLPAARATPATRVFVPAVINNPTPTPTPRPTMALGASVIDRNYELIQAMGFPWVKLYADWDGADPENEVNIAVTRYPGVKILMRIDRSPAAARTGNDDDPIDSAQLQAYLANLVPRMRGRVHAYELFNEPNLKWEWNTHIAGGGNLPSALGYTRVLNAAYDAIKAADPGALVITGGVSPAGNGGPEAIGDLIFLQRMYASGARFDHLGIHPYGGAFTYDQGVGDPTGVYFRRAEEARAVMVQNGDSARGLWATEFGWLVDPRAYGYGTYAGRDCLAGLGGRVAWLRSPSDVATQLAAAHTHAWQNWPWMTGMFMFNFDFSAAGWVNHYDKVCDAPTWYSIVSRANMPGRPETEPAYAALRQFAQTYLGNP